MEKNKMRKIVFGEKVYEENVFLFLQKYPKHLFFMPTKPSVDCFYPTKEGSVDFVIDKGKRRFLYSGDSIFKQHKEKLSSVTGIEDRNVVYIYGLGLGYFYFFLRRKFSKDLVFIEDDPNILAAFLSTSLASVILKDPSAHIYFKTDFEDGSRFLDGMTGAFPFEKTMVICSFFLSDQKKIYFRDLKLRILKSQAYFAADHKEDLYSYLNFKNFINNIQKLSGSFYVNLLKDKFKNIPAVICGAGPSLYNEKDVLKRLEDKALIIAGGSAITALSSYGIKPHAGVIVDPNMDEADRMERANLSDVPVIYSLRVNKDVFKYLNVPLGYVRSVAGGIESLLAEKKFSLENADIVGAGLSRESFSVTTLNVALAHYLGCSPIVLAGVDLALTCNKRYSPGIVDDNLNKMDDSDDPGDVFVQEKTRRTSVKWVMEARALSDYKKKFGLNIII